MFSVIFGGLAGFALGRADLSIAAFGLIMGALFGLASIAERKRMEHYGFLPRTGHSASAAERRED
ncbi:hypothetical protein [Streptomyces chiangmaiensis]|uniref:Glycine zipper family protein n=1 Tax=Streptomyces chiangmaiensis TaxID=766497 RepID=A0ABU7FV39_9ACTN|nr:hypothetical protein [Streptomyces chiangmaiensis]MED7827985.1 hypothetical protein [Streptomyces chiangmaiensis]